VNLKKDLLESINKSRAINGDQKTLLQTVLLKSEYMERVGVTVDQFAEDTGMSAEAVRRNMERLADTPFAELDAEGCSAYRATQVEFSLALRIKFVPPPKRGSFGQGALDLDEDDPDYQDLPAPTLTREQLRRQRHWEEIDSHAGTRYRVVVSPIRESEDSDGVVGYRADVTAKDVGSDAPATTVAENEGPFACEPDAWAWWDSYWPGLAPELAADRLAEQFDAHAWALSLYPSAGGCILLKRSAYDAVVESAKAKGLTVSDTCDPTTAEVIGTEIGEGDAFTAYAIDDENGHDLPAPETEEPTEEPTRQTFYELARVERMNEKSEVPLQPAYFAALVTELFEGLPDDDADRVKAIESGRVFQAGITFVSDENGAPMPSEEDLSGEGAAEDVPEIVEGETEELGEEA
jgi:hypothetical protein